METTMLQVNTPGALQKHAPKISSAGTRSQELTVEGLLQVPAHDQRYCLETCELLKFWRWPLDLRAESLAILQRGGQECLQDVPYGTMLR